MDLIKSAIVACDGSSTAVMVAVACSFSGLRRWNVTSMDCLVTKSASGGSSRKLVSASAAHNNFFVAGFQSKRMRDFIAGASQTARV